ncbi:phosphoadenosine phosphosulfate reductase family protein [Paenibacillus oralis]|nr:phosphoadenosine phosphosulfate reductase family protein [Paenibacillus oralis]
MNSLSLPEDSVLEYRFEDGPNKINPQGDLKRHNSITKVVWAMLQKYEYSFWGVLRNWSAVFQFEKLHMVVHHFINDIPDERLIERSCGLRWDLFLVKEGIIEELFDYFEKKGFTVEVPNQDFVDAYLTEAFGMDDWHLHSPKHKFMIWVRRSDMAFLIELFFDKPYAPYGVKKRLEWPDFQSGQLSLWDDLPDVQKRRKQSTASITIKGEDLTIEEKVPEEVDSITDMAIERIFNENSTVIANYSGGKDSTVIVQKCIKFKLEHPENKTRLVILSADTGGADNPLIRQHIRKTKQAVEDLNLNIEFIIVEPDVENSYFTCVFGKGYQPPSSQFKWCVDRLKITPGRIALWDYVQTGEKVCQILGSRSSESTTRALSVEKEYGDEFYGSHIAFDGKLRTAAPIRHWTARNVVTYLVRNAAPYDYSNYVLLNLYGSAAGGMDECPIGAAIQSESQAVSACTGKSSRFGCAFCTVINEDSSLYNLSLDYPEELENFYLFRTALKRTQDIRYGGFTAFQRKGKYRFEPGFGDMTIGIRTILLRLMREYEIPILEEEVYTIYRMVEERECREGFAVSERFRKALFGLLDTSPIFYPHADPIMNPTGMIDVCTSNDKDAIERVIAMIEAGEIEVAE